MQLIRLVYSCITLNCSHKTKLHETQMAFSQLIASWITDTDHGHVIGRLCCSHNNANAFDFQMNYRYRKQMTPEAVFCLLHVHVVDFN